MTFIKRNAWPLIQIVVCIFGALVSLWIGVTDGNQFWFAGCYVVFVVTAGYWVWAIFDNAETDALYAEVQRMAADIEATEDPYLAGEVRRVLNGEEAQ